MGNFDLVVITTVMFAAMLYVITGGLIVAFVTLIKAIWFPNAGKQDDDLDWEFISSMIWTFWPLIPILFIIYLWLLLLYFVQKLTIGLAEDCGTAIRAFFRKQ